MLVPSFKSKSSRIVLASLLVIAASLMIILILFQRPESYFVDKLNSRIHHLGIKVSAEEIEITPLGFSLRGVLIDGVLKASVDSLTISTSMDITDLAFNIDLIELANFRGSARLGDLKSLSKKLIPSKKAATTSEAETLTSIKNIIVDDASFDLLDDSDSSILFSAQTPHVEVDVLGKLAKVTDLNVAKSSKPLLEQVSMELKADSNALTYLAHSDSTKQGSYWSVNGTIDFNGLSNSTLLKFAGLPNWIPESLKNIFISEKPLLSAIKINLPLEPILNRILKASDPSQPAPKIPMELHYGMANFEVKNPILSKGVVGPASFYATSKLTYDPDSDRLDVASGLFRIKPRSRGISTNNPLSLEFSGSVSNLLHSGSSQRTQFKVNLPETECQLVADSIPQGLAPVLDEFRLIGTLAGSIALTVDSNAPEQLKPSIDVKRHCEMIPLTPEFSKAAIKQRVHSQLSRHESREYTSIEDISRYLTKALVTFEDGGFYGHDGVQFESIIQALRQNLSKGAVTAGGSTITQQMVKNLFLTRERTLERKIQEIFLTWYIESILTKQEILETYANIIEFGPDIFGISQAALMLFGKSPAMLSVREAAYLASVLPSPVARFRNFCRGTPTEAYREFLDKRLRLMHTQGHISDEELHEALLDRLEFRSDTQHPYCQNLAGSTPTQAF